MGNTKPMLQISGVGMTFSTRRGPFVALRDIDLTVARGDKVVACGPSGSGKSTLIRLVNRLEVHQAGRVIVDGVELDFEMYGKDHSTNTPIYDGICEVLGGRKPEHFIYELFLDDKGEPSRFVRVVEG